METYFPEKDLSTERFRGNLMQAGIKMNEIVSKKSIDSKNSEIL